jgi:hypothetical protein
MKLCERDSSQSTQRAQRKKEIETKIKRKSRKGITWIEGLHGLRKNSYMLLSM